MAPCPRVYGRSNPLRVRADRGSRRGTAERPAGTSERTAPVETFEPRIVPVSRNPLAAGLNGDGRVPGVLNQIAGGLRFTAQPLEQWPVTCPWRDDRHVRLRPQRLPKRL